MTPEQWEEVGRIFDAAAALPPEERSPFLDQACGANAALRREVQALLETEDRAKDFLNGAALEDVAKVLAKDEPSSLAGKSLGHYELRSLIGTGGMGEVYRAHDVALKREVAVKILPSSLSHNGDRLRRFKQEARAASALNHPNIVTVHEIGELDGCHFIVGEYVDGETLRQRLMRGQMDLAEVIDVATQIASGLAAAHAVGVIHRDIKPENVMLRPDGYVKILDFGLAKLSARADLTTTAGPQMKTDTGVVMGTSRYMSPEQARGLAIDARTDVWSLGVLVYEMLTGRVPFEGETNSDVIAAILEHEPAPLVFVASEVRSELQRIVTKALRKDPERRYQTIKDMLVDLNGLRRYIEFAGKKTPRVFWAVAIMVGLALLVFSAWRVSHLITKPAPPQPALTAIPLTTDLGFEGLPSLSPDGNQVAYASGGPESNHFDIYVKQIGGGPARRLTSDPATDEFPAWSPDGRSIAFIRDRGDKLDLLLIPSSGGPERKIAEIARDTSTAIIQWTPPYVSWTPDSRYLVAPDVASPGEALSLFLFSTTTGEKRRLTTPPPTTLGDGNPAVSPDGRTLAFARILRPGRAQLHLLSLSGDYEPEGEPRRLDLPQPLAKSPVWTADGREIVCNAGAPWVGGALWRVAVSGSEKPKAFVSLGEDVCCATISRQGNRLVYARWTWDLDVWRTEITRKGKTGPAVKLIASTRSEIQPQYSPDASKIIFASDRSGPTEIWMCNSDGSDPLPLTSLEAKSGSPRWFPDGRHIVFDSDKEGTFDVYVIEIATLVPRRLTDGKADNGEPSVSHDGKWIYFGSRRTGNWEIWRMPPEGGEGVQLTRHGGEWPFESVDGKIIYYLKGQDVWQVPVSGGEETRVLGPIEGYTFAVTAQGIYFLESGSPLWLGSSENALKFYSFATRSSERIADIKLRPDDGLSVSFDGRYALTPMVDPFVSDLMLVENFR